MGQCKKNVTPLLTHWSYVFLALTHRYELWYEELLNRNGFGTLLLHRLKLLLLETYKCFYFMNANYTSECFKFNFTSHVLWSATHVQPKNGLITMDRDNSCISGLLVVVILFPTEYKQWRTEYMSNITTTINIDDPVGGHQISQRLIGLATKGSKMWNDKIQFDKIQFGSWCS